VTRAAIGRTAEWTNKVEAADIDVDGDVDLLFANGGEYEHAGRPEASRVFLNRGDATFTEATRQVFGGMVGTTRVIKVADVNADGVPDIVLGTTYGSQSRLYLGDKNGGWEDATSTHLPSARLSIGDLELGDVDADGDLDAVLADWGSGSPMKNNGGVVQLWLNDGSGRFTDATKAQMPHLKVQFSWDLELVDVDNDWDLDVAVSCKMCPSSLLYDNDGTGQFTDATAQHMPMFTNNYDFAPLDLDGDGYLDLVTVNDGDATSSGLAEHVFRNDHDGGFDDVTAEWWPPASNVGWDDNVVVALDVESDGDEDFVIGSLDGPDRLLVNDGTGALAVNNDIFDGEQTLGTLGVAIADLNGDRRVDIVESQGEMDGYTDERVYVAGDQVLPDSARPVVRTELVDGLVLARVHDNLTPNMSYQWRKLVVRTSAGGVPMAWYGENLYRAKAPARGDDIEVCATDAAGNKACAPVD
jgi:hypothetical protein